MKTLDNLLLHNRSALDVKNFLGHPAQALLITGTSGSGKKTVGLAVAAKLLGLEDLERLNNYPFFVHLERRLEEQDIPIEEIRRLRKFMTLKIPGNKKVGRVVLIENAQDLNEESASALLKMLEEPADDCIFVLSALSASTLLPTIVSRTQEIKILPVNLHQAHRYLDDKYAPSKIESAWQLSQGAVGLMLAILESSQKHPFKIAIDEAKNYLQADKYQRLLESDTLAQNKQHLALRLEALSLILAALSRSAVKRGDRKRQKQLLASRQLCFRLLEALDSNVAAKLLALELALKLI